MKVAIEYILISFLFFFIFCSCKKDSPAHTGFELSAVSENNSVVLNWTRVLLSGFKNISIYRSTSPISDPGINNPIDRNLLIATIVDQTITTFRDSNFVINQDGNVFYKIVLNLNNRVIPSNEMEIYNEGFTVPFHAEIFQAGQVLTVFPERNLFYLFSHTASRIHLVDYSQKKVIGTFPFPIVNALYPSVNSGNYELFAIASSTEIVCYDALTLNSKYSLTIPSAKIGQLKLVNHFMYVVYYTNNMNIAHLRVYDLSSKTIAGEKILYQSPNIGGFAIYIDEQSNSLFLKYRTQLFNGLGTYVYRNVCIKYHMIDHLPADSVIISHPLLTADSIGGNGFHYINPSPDFKYLACNSKGDILSLADQTVHNVASNSNLITNIEFSSSGSYILAKSWNFTRGDVYRLPGFSFVASVRTPNSKIDQNSFFIHVRDISIDNDTLLSYSFKCSNVGGQLNSLFSLCYKRFE